jgi:hypothetical protein
MALTVNTSNPRALLNGIRKAIDDKKVETWEYDKDGDFTHKPEQWRNAAWLRPVVGNGVLQFGLLGPQNKGMTKLIYGVYHGRFIEMMLTHFDNDFSSASATAQDQSGLDHFTRG